MLMNFHKLQIHKKLFLDKHYPYLESVYKVDILSPSPTPPLKGGAILLPSPLRGEGKGEGV
jgi:hypothetical protein